MCAPLFMRNMNKISLKGHAMMAGANTMWGLMAPVSKFVMAAGFVSPLLLTQFRVFGAAALFWIAGSFKRETVALPDLLRMAVAACFAIIFNQGTYIFGVGLTSPSEASIITTTMPMWVMILGWVFLHEKLTGRKITGVACGAAGALLLILGSASGARNGDSPLLGDILVMTAQLSYACYLTFFKDFIRKYSLTTLMKWMFLFAALAMSPALLYTLPPVEWSSIPAVQWGGVGYVVVGGTFVAYLLGTKGQKILSPVVVGMYNYVQPIVASLAGIALGLDSFSLRKGVAIVLIFTGVYLVSNAVKKQTPAVD